MGILFSRKYSSFFCILLLFLAPGIILRTHISAQDHVSNHFFLDLTREVKILPLGDSITQSVSEHFSYRYYLWQKLIETDFNCDFVGSINHNYNGNPSWDNCNGLSFDRDHEGHWGWHANEIQDHIQTWLNQYSPDIVLLYIGTNDIFSGESASQTSNEILGIIRELRFHDPQIAILLGKLYPTTYIQFNNSILELNLKLEVFAIQESTSQSPIVIVDHFTGFDPDLDTTDGIHPNDSGEKKMANNWFIAIQDLIGTKVPNWELYYI